LRLHEGGNLLANPIFVGTVRRGSGFDWITFSPLLELPEKPVAGDTRVRTYRIEVSARRSIEDLLTRPRGRPSHAPLVRYWSFEYQAALWDQPRRVIAKIEHHLGELFPRVGFIVTILTGTNRAVVRFYNQRGTAEQWIKEGKEATHWTRLSCHRFRVNEVRLLLGVIAYNLGNLLRRLVLPVAIQSWSLTSHWRASSPYSSFDLRSFSGETSVFGGDISIAVATALEITVDRRRS